MFLLESLVFLAVILTRALPAVSAVVVPSDTIVARPDGHVIDGSRVTPYTTHWRVTYQMADGSTVPGGPTRTVSWYDTLTLEISNGHRMFHRRQTLYAPDSVLLEVLDNWADAKTLGAERTQLKLHGASPSTRHYEDRLVTGTDPDSTAEGGVRPVRVELPERVFDFYGGIFDVLLAAAPKRIGSVIKFPTDDPTAKGGAGLLWTTATVTGRELLTTSTTYGTVNTWRIEAPAAASASGAHFVFWIADRAPYLVRMWYVGPRGGRQVWDITSPAP